MSEELEAPVAGLSGTARERELQAKLNKRGLWLFLLAFVALAELLVVVELARSAA